MKRLTCLLLALVLTLSLTACGGSSNAAAQKYDAAARPEAAPAEAPAAMAMGADAGASLNSRGPENGADAGVPDNRKWIITADMSVETDDLDTLQQMLVETISALEGYIESQNVYNGSSHASRRYRNANLTVRIPADRVSEFTQQIGGMANVVSNNLRREDVTLQYVDTEGRVKALQTEEARLLELLAAAQNMSDLLEIEARLADVRYELESYTSRLRTLDNQIDYATVYLFIEEVQEYTPVEEPTFLERIRKGFSDSLSGIAEGAVDFTVWILANSPYLVVYGVLGAVVFLLVKKVRPLKKQKKQIPPEKESDQK